MSMESTTQAFLRVAETLGGTRISGSAFFAGAKTLLADGTLSRVWSDIEHHEWSDLVDVGIARGARIIGIIDPALTPIAPLVAAIIVYARHHPAGTLSEVMSRADGQGGTPSTGHVPA